MTEEIRGEIQRVGPISFERFMELALYGEAGFYMRVDGGSAGRRGDFITSPEVGPLFGAVLADSSTRNGTASDGPTVHRRRRRCRPRNPRPLDPRRDPLPRRARYVAVEMSAAQRDRHPDGIESGPTSAGTIDGVILANELLDNLPFRLAVFDDGWREALVDLDRSGASSRCCRRRSIPFRLAAAAPPSAPARPLIDRAAAFIAERPRCSVAASSCIDYGVPRTGELAMRPWREWLRTYRSNERGGHYLADAGGQDITIDVPFDQLPSPTRSGRSRSSSNGGGSRSSSTKASVSGPSRRPAPASRRCGCAAGSARPKPCSTPPGSGPS